MSKLFTDNEINTIKSIPLEVIFKDKGLTLKKEGQCYKALCPFHEDKNASLTINTKENLFKCFGCGTAGSNIDFVMKKDNLSFVKAVQAEAHKRIPCGPGVGPGTLSKVSVANV